MSKRLRRLSPRWLVELAGASALVVACFLAAPIVGCVALGVGLALEANFAEPLLPPTKD